MADTKKPDAPEKNEQTVLGSDKAPPDKEAQLSAQDQAHDKEAPPVSGPEQPAPGGNKTPPARSDIPGTTEALDKAEKPVPEQPVKSIPSKVTKKAVPGKAADAEALRKDEAAIQAALNKKPASHSRKPVGEKADQSKAADKNAARRGRPPKADKAPKTPDKPRAPLSPEQEKAMADYNEALAEWESKQPWERSTEPPKKPKPPKAPKKESADKTAPAQKEPEAPAPPPVPREAPRSAEPEQVVFIPLSELHPFNNHPFGVRDDAEMRALAESVKEKGVNQPALVRPRPEGGYEIVAGHRRQKASELAGFTDMRCIVRDMTDDEAILAMTDDNLRQRSEILPSEKAVSLKMQVEAIKHQGARSSGQIDQKQAGQRSVDIVGERNGMNPKQVQRYIRLTELVPDLIKAVDEGQIGFTPAVEFSFIRPKNQNLIAVSLEGQQIKPSLSQAQEMRKMDEKGTLNGDAIDGILCEPKKEVDKVIINSAELEKYFGKDKTPRQMKDQIIKLLGDWSEKEKGLTKPEKKADLEK